MILRVVFLLAALLVDVPSSGGKEIGPDVPWCQAIHSLAPGEELVLRPGEYQGPCSIRRGGTPAAPVVIRAKEVQHPSRIVYRGRDSNLLNVYADHVIIRGLQFDRTLPNVDAIRIYTGNDVTVEDCRFIEIEGNSIAATNAVRARPGIPAFPPGRMGLRIAGNVDCARVGCFMDPDQHDVSPLAFPPGISFRDTWMPSDDFFGHRRSAAPIPGAIERLDPSRWVSSPSSPKAIGNIRASIPHP